ncbi:MAG: hypothetical protein PHC41_00040 [Lachnospiraceae bacterium]|nr:hypothetical protein [Lachnospiraceae bacterium]MDD3614595.1 hypothetical protein [Lachnospiraceae bacterium]
MSETVDRMQPVNPQHIHGFDRHVCMECMCANCYKQEFCDRCSTCEDTCRKKESCDAFEGSFNY